jgi:hypothetical protein
MVKVRHEFRIYVAKLKSLKDDDWNADDADFAD